MVSPFASSLSEAMVIIESFVFLMSMMLGDNDDDNSEEIICTTNSVTLATSCF